MNRSGGRKCWHLWWPGSRGVFLRLKGMGMIIYVAKGEAVGLRQLDMVGVGELRAGRGEGSGAEGSENERRKGMFNGLAGYRRQL